MTHEEVTKRIEQWLIKTKRCSFSFVELRSFTDSGEIPDNIGWRCTDQVSILVEAKISKTDFMSDQKKPFRQNPMTGVGNYRYYACPPDVIHPEWLPAQWGLLYLYPTLIRVIQEAEPFLQPIVGMNERPILMTALRRVHIRGDLQKIYDRRTVPK